MKAISPTLDLGEGVTVAAFEAAVNLPVTLIAQYNAILSQADDVLNQINAASVEMNQMSVRVLDGGKFKFGANSSEYEMLGGTRKSERRKPLRKTGDNAVNP
ncbi:MAG TPA: hypothetical protein VNB22_11690 [Pyrinomonadaceae bacterium]|nr:hypothetical protein [Pyrinomonadaceae bacterium]